MAKPLGFYFNVTSPFNKQPLLVVLTKSRNRKTGAMIQSWILDKNSNPLEALHSGADESICGHCPQRPVTGGKCYVAVGRAPMSIWRAYQRRRYVRYERPKDLHAWAGGAPWRLGAYGDPAMVPESVWTHLLRVAGAPGWTGYTHQWLAPWTAAHKALCMASVESESEARLAQGMGWRTFRTAPAGAPLAKNEFACPASEEQGKRLTCENCLACNGNPHVRDARKAGSVLIQLHGFRVGKRKVTV